MTLSDFETIYYTLAFIVPGFVLHSVYSASIPQRTDSQFSVIRFLYFSCINYAVWSGLIYALVKVDYFKDRPILTSVIWGWIILISPILLGLIAGFFSEKEFARKWLQKIGLNPVHVIPTAWDYKFSKVAGNTWILVTLKDGSTVAGMFGKRSFASSIQDERDLYIEKVFKIVDSGPWEPVETSDGIHIPGSEIKYVEFWK